MTDISIEGIESIENRIHHYIAENKLNDGSQLPPPHDLSARLGCNEESLVKALHSADAKGTLSYENGAWTVVLPETVSDHSFSFTKSAGKRDLTTELIEAAVRLPMGDRDHPLYLVEQRVQEALGLTGDSPFIVIERLRLLGGRPGAFQRAYLNPSKFSIAPEAFLKNHDFRVESLISIYQQYEHKLLSRDTILAARFANLHEKNTVNRYRPRLETSVVLDAEQKLYAENPKYESPFVLEFLKASYLENWRYEIKSRPA